MEIRYYYLPKATRNCGEKSRASKSSAPTPLPCETVASIQHKRPIQLDNFKCQKEKPQTISLLTHSQSKYTGACTYRHNCTCMNSLPKDPMREGFSAGDTKGRASGFGFGCESGRRVPNGRWSENGSGGCAGHGWKGKYCLDLIQLPGFGVKRCWGSVC